MKVKDLIAFLQEVDPELEVLIENAEFQVCYSPIVRERLVGNISGMFGSIEITKVPFEEHKRDKEVSNIRSATIL